MIAKDADGEYREGERGWLKVKHLRTADCVVAGFRVHKDGKGVGSLLLGLFDDDGRLQHVGVASSFTAARREELVEELAPYRTDSLKDHPWAEWGDAERTRTAKVRMPGAPSRWNAKKDMSWEPLRIGLVAEVAYEHVPARPVPAHRALPALAPRPRARRRAPTSSSRSLSRSSSTESSALAGP